MRREDKKKLTINRRIIVNHLLDLEGVLDYLIAKQIFTPSIRERIIYENKVPSDRIRQTLDCLITRNALAYQYFLEALVLTDNTHLANLLEPEFGNSEACRLMIERERIMLPFVPAHNQHQVNQLTKNFSFPNACIGQSGETANSPYLIAPIHHYQRAMQPQNHQPVQMSTTYQQQYFHQQNLAYRLFANSNSNFSSQSNSRSSSQSQSMSPIANRVRSSSVTGLTNPSGGSGLARKLPNRPSTSKSFIRSSSNDFIDEDPLASPASTALPVTTYDDHDQMSPSVNVLPPTYNIDWSDVNGLELDFVVYKTLPNVRQLGPNECYSMQNEPRGLCLIINNEHFYDVNGVELPQHRRYGTDMDASRLKNLFEKLSFCVEMRVDLTEREMRRHIHEFADKSDSQAYDAICLIILSHGTDGYIYGVDFENRINMDKDILNLFDDVLIGKPKMFIFQACRGEHLNQKDPLPPTANIISQSCSAIITRTSAKQQTLTNITGSTSCSSMDDETIKKFRNLKMNSTQPGSLQLMFKKKSATHVSSSSSSSTSSSSSSIASSLSNSKMKTRSRSHSRGKYSTYLASAKSAIKTAMRTSPNSTKAMLTSISTQTTGSSALISSCSEQVAQANCYLNSNIITSTTCNQSFMNFIDGRPIKTSLPSRSDFFIWYSSARGFVSHRDQDGSPFIKCLVTVFSRCSYELELIEMVRKVNMLMQQYEKRHFDERNAIASYFMVPVAEYHLAKRLYFNP